MARGTEITSQPSHWFWGEAAMNVERSCDAAQGHQLKDEIHEYEEAG